MWPRCCFHGRKPRQREIATRLALGAGRGRIVRQLLTESMVLAALAGSVGFVLSWSASRALLRIAVPTAERLPVDLAPDVRVALFALLVSTLTCLLFGVIPAWRVTSSRSISVSRQIGGRQGRLLDRILVASQVALSLGADCRRWTLSSQPRQPVGAGDRLRPPQRAHVLGGCEARRSR
ncbi:MAG: FtsX-like permease family protein [Luteitalea sp.]|nr:FtsX-like permease family protein [Luteitalea sp.]